MADHDLRLVRWAICLSEAESSPKHETFDPYRGGFHLH